MLLCAVKLSGTSCASLDAAQQAAAPVLLTYTNRSLLAKLT